MDVKFITTTRQNLDLLPVKNGQVIGLSDGDAFYYDMGDARRPVSGVREVHDELPETGQPDILYVLHTETYAKSYIWCGSEYIDVTGLQYKELTTAEYEALTEAERMNGTMYLITDSSSYNFIDDFAVSQDSTYSSQKIVGMINTSNGIDDSTTSATSTYSSTMIEAKLSALADRIQALEDEVAELKKG